MCIIALLLGCNVTTTDSLSPHWEEKKKHPNQLRCTVDLQACDLNSHTRTHAHRDPAKAHTRNGVKCSCMEVKIKIVDGLLLLCSHSTHTYTYAHS